MQANIWHNPRDANLYRETAAFVEGEPRPGVIAVSEFLRERAKPDTITLVVGQFIVSALFEGRHADLLYWSLIAAEACSAGMDQWPSDVRDELASYLRRSFTKLMAWNGPH